MLVLWLAGCHWFPPAVTSGEGMAGQIREPGGAPVVGMRVENLESGVLTDAEGRFGLYYRPPDTFVSFTWNEMPYRRTFRPADEGQVVEVLLPPIRDLEVVCGPTSCALTLDWDLADGLSARFDGRCEAGSSRIVKGAPQGVPVVSCRPRVTEPPLAVGTRFSTDRLELLPPPRTVTVEITGDERPADCRVWVGDTAGQPVAGGLFEVQVSGEAFVEGVCAGRPATPTRVAATEDRVGLTWMADGPELRPPPDMVLDRLILTRDGTDGWELRGAATAEGGFLLPPLPAGRYTIQLHNGEPSRVPVVWTSEPEPDRVSGQMLASGQYAGVLVVTHDRGDGVLQAGVDE